MNSADKKMTDKKIGTMHRLAMALLKSIFLSPIFLSATVVYPQTRNSEWAITLEEPTGIYRRDQEVVSVPMSFRPGEAQPRNLHVVDPTGATLQSQIVPIENYSDGSLKRAEILFRATIVPGERPRFRLVTAPTPDKSSDGPQSVLARRIATGRVEMGNERFAVILNLGFEGTEPALVTAYNRTSGEMRMLNLIETTPDVSEPIRFGRKSAGFGTFLESGERAGVFDKVEILESGPLRGRVRVSGSRLGSSAEMWEFVWTANSPVLTWTASLDPTSNAASYGFFLSCISASPYLPFDRWIEGVELRFPDGWETDKPPDHRIAGKNVRDLEGGHIVYYQREENYGAIGIYELDPTMEWEGVGGRQILALAPSGASKRSIKLGIAFPRWKGTETVLEARKEYRIYRQPILAVTTGPQARAAYAVPARSVVDVRSYPLSEINSARLDQTPSIDLNGKWKLNGVLKAEGETLGFHNAGFDDRGWREVQVPGTVHTQILEPPKYFSKEAEWISEREWWYRRNFTVPATFQNQRLFVAFGATDYFADIYINGRLLARHEGYIDPHEVEVTRHLKLDGDNTIAVRVWTPVSYYWRHRPYTIKGSYGAVDQKPDKITPLGITRPVHLVARRAIRIEEVATDTILNPDGSADLVVELAIDSTKSGTQAEVALFVSPRNFAGASGLGLRAVKSVATGSQRERFVIRVEKPELWWTWDHGKPNLYTLDIYIREGDRLSDRMSFAIGFREIEHIDWKFYLNGKRMFIRGSNFYYHLFQSEVRRADYERDFKLMLGMNINMLRLHCNFSNPEFYDLADELGILVWQDYLEAWYPEDRAFSLKAAALYDAHIRYVRNHPSIAIWATSDEESLENYRDLTKHLEPRLFLHDPQRRPVQRSTGRYGDAHVYEGWYTGTIWNYAKMTEKFVSELGATALPNYDSLMKFIPNAWPIKEHEEEWVFRKLQLREAMQAWGEPGAMTLQEYIPQTQAYVARLFQLAIERMRRLKYQPAGGILHFHAIDLWPSVTMAAIDFYRQPTKAYQTVRQSFQMVLPSFAYDRDRWRPGDTVKAELWVINDHLFKVPGVRVSWRLVAADGTVSTRGEHPIALELAADSSLKLTDVSVLPPSPGRYSLIAAINSADGKVVSENTYEFRVERESESQRKVQ